jgi:hypothetical protein
MRDHGEDVPFRGLKRMSALGAVLAFRRASRRGDGVPEAIARSLGDRLREVLPSDEFTIEVRGPVLDVKSVRGYSATGMLLLAERGAPEEKLARVFMEEASSLRAIITRASRQGSADDPAKEARLPAAFFDPHVAVTDSAIDIWWGGADAEQALVRLRPIARSEIGL